MRYDYRSAETSSTKVLKAGPDQETVQINIVSIAERALGVEGNHQRLHFLFLSIPADEDPEGFTNLNIGIHFPPRDLILFENKRTIALVISS